MPPTPVAATMPADRLNHSSSGTRLGRAGVGYSRTDAEGGCADDADDRDTGNQSFDVHWATPSKSNPNEDDRRRSRPTCWTEFPPQRYGFDAASVPTPSRLPRPTARVVPVGAQNAPPLAGRRQPQGLPSGSLCRDELGHRGPVRRMDDPVGDLAVLRTE